MTTTGPGDLDRLFRTGVEGAGRALAAGSPLWPFAVGLTLDGVVVSPGVDPGEPRPPVERVLRLLREALVEGREDLRAAGVVAPVQVEGSTALRFELEERYGEAVVILVPYRPGPEFGAPTRSPGRRRVWT